MTSGAMDLLHGARRDADPRLLAKLPDLADVPVFGGGDQEQVWDAGLNAGAQPELDSVLVDGVAVAKGSRVLLRPSRRADAQDLFLAGLTAVVSRVYFDLDGGTHVAVVLEDDPAFDLYGIGNIFLTDDGFGSEVARKLAGGPLPDGVSVVDYGIRGMHLAYDLLDGYDALVVVDALPGKGSPGDLSVLEIGPDDLGEGELDAHGMAPVAVLASLGSLGGSLPADVGEGMGLTPAVAAAVDGAVELVHEVLGERLGRSAAPPAERSRASASASAQEDLP
jgi:hydrogenase maturation protease